MKSERKKERREGNGERRGDLRLVVLLSDEGASSCAADADGTGRVGRAGEKGTVLYSRWCRRGAHRRKKQGTVPGAEGV